MTPLFVANQWTTRLDSILIQLRQTQRTKHVRWRSKRSWRRYGRLFSEWVKLRIDIAVKNLTTFWKLRNYWMHQFCLLLQAVWTAPRRTTRPTSIIDFSGRCHYCWFLRHLQKRFRQLSLDAAWTHNSNVSRIRATSTGTDFWLRFRSISDGSMGCRYDA